MQRALDNVVKEDSFVAASRIQTPAIRYGAPTARCLKAPKGDV
jgi:hypothetical protein